MLDKAIGSLTGLAIGDALGTTIEFKDRDTYQHLTDIVGGGPFRLQPGQWTDDTSMALCYGQSLIDNKGLEPHHLMHSFNKWYKTGYMSVTGRCFDIGNATKTAINKFLQTGNPLAGDTHYASSGNGAIMRLSPGVIYHHTNLDEAIKLTHNQSLCTHASQECLESARLMAYIVYKHINNENIDYNNQYLDIKSLKVLSIVNEEYKNKSRNQIKSSGYVIDTLEAALWSVHNTNNFKDAVLLAANLGEDADTVAAVAGQIAGAKYGHSSIPEEWMNKLYWNDMIIKMAKELYE